MKFIRASLIGIAFFASPAMAQPLPITDLLAIQHELNNLCRGWPGDVRTDEVCELRDQMDKLLNRLGYCYGKRDQIGADMRLHKCTKESNRP